ncbi:hypothetical protein SynPROS71_02908 [Synechococcus sp. PROS-7-1]|nr:hypothetical protein SynPROS71_02908 [Synechococcus sp. PROS-7-1]
MLEFELASLLGIGAPAFAAFTAFTLWRRLRKQQPPSPSVQPTPPPLSARQKLVWGLLQFLKVIPGYSGSRLQQLVETMIAPPALMAWS